jgi:hypothetical protein
LPADPSERRLHAQVAVEASWARTPDRAARTKPARDAAASDKLGETLITARRARRLDWRAFRDDGVTEVLPARRFTGERGFFDWVGRAWVDHFELDPTIGQSVAVEVWCEAAGMTAQIDRVCDPYGVPVYSGSGFESLSAKLEIVERIVRHADTGRGRRTVVLRIGDLDPSGRCVIDAFAADVWAFLSEYRRPGAGAFGDRSPDEHLSDLLEVEHLAVTEAQVEEHDLPTVPQKASDRRGETMSRTVQAEALPPDVLANVLGEAIRVRLNVPMLDVIRKRGALERARVTDRFYDQRSGEFWAAFMADSAGNHGRT